jgi:hypothetical protein
MPPLASIERRPRGACVKSPSVDGEYQNRLSSPKLWNIFYARSVWPLIVGSLASAVDGSNFQPGPEPAALLETLRGGLFLTLLDRD